MIYKIHIPIKKKKKISYLQKKKFALIINLLYIYMVDILTTNGNAPLIYYNGYPFRSIVRKF